MSRGRRRRRRRSTQLPAAAAQGQTAAAAVAAAAAPSPTVSSRGSPRAPTQGPSGLEAGEQVWERTHLEQAMFALARDHAAAAARGARSSPGNREDEQTHSLVAILMSFLALEAFINMVGWDRLGGRYRHYDRMSPEGKWMEVTRLVSKTGKTFDEDGEELRALSTLRGWRNMLTHYKGEYEEVQQTPRGGETRVEALLSAENAARAVDIAQTLYRAFYAMDRRSPPRQFIWLDDRPHRPRIPGTPPSPSATGDARTPRPGAADQAAVPGTVRTAGSRGGHRRRR